MSTTAWIIVIVVVLAVAAAVAWAGDRRRRQQKVEHAEGLRHEAREHAAGIPEAEERARQAEVERARVEAERAQQRAQEAQVAATQQQAVHEDRLRTADEVDPRVDTSSEDYAPGTQVDGTDSAGRAPRT